MTRMTKVAKRMTYFDGLGTLARAGGVCVFVIVYACMTAPKAAWRHSVMAEFSGPLGIRTPDPWIKSLTSSCYPF